MSTLTGTIIIALILCGLAILGVALSRKSMTPSVDLAVHSVAALVALAVIVVVGYASGVLR